MRIGLFAVIAVGTLGCSSSGGGVDIRRDAGGQDVLRGPDARPAETGHAGKSDAVLPKASVPPRTISGAPWSLSETDPTIAASPDGTLAAVWMAVPSVGWAYQLGYSLSRDGGVSWTGPVELDSPSGRISSDPFLIADADGGFYLTWDGLELASDEADAIYVAYLAKGVSSFGPAMLASDPSVVLYYDQPKVHRLTSGTLLVAYNARPDDAVTTANEVALARSTDRGVTWTHGTLATGDGYRNQPYFCGVTSAEDELAIYLGTEGLILRASHDDGATWSTLATVLGPADFETVEFEPRCVAKNDDVWVLYSLGAPGATFADWKSNAVLVVHSVDGGHTFQPPVSARDPSAPPYGQHATLALAASGDLEVTYVAGRTDFDPAGSARAVRSTNGGSSFGGGIDLGGALFNGVRSSAMWTGDYMGLTTSPNGPFDAMFVSGASGNPHVVFVASLGDTRDATAPPDSGAGRIACPATTTLFSPPKYVPTTGHQGVCTPDDIQSFISDCIDGDPSPACNALAVTNPSCASCIFAPLGNGAAATDGYPNYAACIQLVDPASGPLCAAAYEAYQSCISFACEACSTSGADAGGAAQACVSTAEDGGCHRLLSAYNSACAMDDRDGGPASECSPGAATGSYDLDFTFIIGLVCGSSGAG